MGTYDKVASPFHDVGSQKLLSRKMVEGFRAYCAIQGIKVSDLDVIQGSWNRGVAVSGGTHDGSGVADLSAYDRLNKSKIMRLLGFPGWPRTPAEGNWGAHCHFCTNRDPNMASFALVQNRAYLAGYNGLGNGYSRKDGYWRPRYPDIIFSQGDSIRRWTAKKATHGYSQPGGHKSDIKTTRAKGWTWGSPNVATVKCQGEYWLVTSSLTFYRKSDFRAYIPVVDIKQPVVKTTFRPMHFNLPGEDKLPNSAKRAKAGAILVKNATPSWVGFNELIGTETNDGHASKFAKVVDTELGAGWSWVVPTLPYNENYLAYPTARTKKVKQYPDTILTSSLGGRHVTRVVLADVETKQPVAVGVMHLVNGEGAGYEAARQDQARQALLAMREVSAKHGGCPIVFQGDMNTYADLKAFKDAGYVNVRKVAKATTNGVYSTFDTYKDDTPNKDAKWIIDQIWVPKSWVVNGYTVVLGLDPNHTFPTIRPSDHLPIIASATN